MLRPLAASLLLLLAIAAPAVAQPGPSPRPAPAVEVFTGYAGFADEGLIGHAVVGTSARVYLSPRIAVGPELAYMRGPGSDRDLFLTGNLTFDVLSPRLGRPRRVSPFLVIGGGLMRHSNSFGASTFSTTEGAWTGGGGVRAWITDRAYALAEFRMGWEPHVRVTGGIGVSLGR